MKSKRFIAGLLACLLLGTGLAYADWTAPDANLAAYEAQYGEAAEEYKAIRYGADGEAIATAKETLAAFGFFPYKVSNNYYRTLETALRVFETQLRLGGDGSTLSPLVQAILADKANLPRAISPAIDVYDHSWEPDGKSFTAYTFARLSRTGVQTDTRVGFYGVITAMASASGDYTYCVQLEDDPEKIVYVTYEPLPRTTVYQVGDAVAVFGVTQGEQSFDAYLGMETPALLVKADRVGYAP